MKHSTQSNLTTIDKLFIVLRLINDSCTPVSIIDISEELGYGIRTVQRLAMRLATEGLVDFKGGKTNSYLYFKLGENNVS